MEDSTSKIQRRITSREIGAHFENVAKEYLRTKGYTFLEANFRTRQGEIDLIFQRNFGPGFELIFVEVKQRRLGGVSLSVEAVSRLKALRIKRVAQAWLAQQQSRFKARLESVRFDLLAIEGSKIEHLEGFLD